MAVMLPLVGTDCSISTIHGEELLFFLFKSEEVVSSIREA